MLDKNFDFFKFKVTPKSEEELKGYRAKRASNEARYLKEREQRIVRNRYLKSLAIRLG